MVCEFKTWSVGVGVLEVDDDELLVLVRGQEERRLASGFQAEDVAVLRLLVSARRPYNLSVEVSQLTSLCAKTRSSFTLSAPPCFSSSHFR